jgi:hypothetical protein
VPTLFWNAANLAVLDKPVAAFRRIAMCQGFEKDQSGQGILDILK